MPTSRMDLTSSGADEPMDELSPRVHSPALQPLFQSLMATLTNMDVEYERERDKIRSSSSASNAKIRAQVTLERHHREKREPYVQQLGVLQDRILGGRH